MHIFTSSKKKWTSLLVSFLVLLSTQLFAQSQMEPGTFPISSAKARISNSPLSNRSAIINASGTVVANSGVGLQKFYSATGKYTISADGIGSGNSSMNIRVNKPNAGATVKKAVLISAVTFSTIGDNCVSIDGNPVVWDGTAHASFFNNYWADVTSLVASKINSFPAGISSLAITECNSGSIDGEALLVVFDDASATEKTIIIMTGAMNPAGDNFGVTLSQPIDPSQPGALLDMGLGIGFSYQQGGGSQASQVSVNGQRLTSSAGGEDDGQPANGALITVGGIGDKNDNPANPFAGPANPRSDDELYNILPFINNTTTNLTINTINPSQDDNIFLAYFSLSGAAIIGEGILTSQTTTSATTGGNHTVKAVVLNSLGAPVANRNVQFSITSGPNAGGTFTTTTNANGEAFYTYSDLGGAGTDNISACFTDSQNQLSCSNSVAFTWIAPAATLSTAVLEFSNYCPGASLNVPYTVSGTYNASNTFTAQLSNASGSFASPSNIGSVNSTTSGNINATIPSNTPAGTGYRIRVVSSSPALTGSDNGSDFTINPLPTITCPGNQSAFTEAGQCGAHVNFSASGNGVVSYSIAPGSLFPLGTTTVIATVTNSCGSVQCQFNVTVTDNVPPAITAPNATIASCLATIPDLTSSATVSDNCSAASSIVVTQSPAAGTPISPGSTVTVTLTATDASNNQSSVDITVTRPDITPVAVNDAAEVCGGSSVNINVLANDSHPQNLPLTVSDNTTPSVGTLVKNADNTFTYTAPANYSGPVTFNYTIKANDGVIPYSGNNHYYEYVPAYGITWQQAKAAAAARTYNGLKGYLVTVTSAQEQAFVQAKLQGSGWMGASDLAYEGTWRWVTGPEGLEDLGQGRIFSDQRKLPYGTCGANTGQGVGGNYVNWTAGEPNDCGAYLNQFSPTDPNRGGEHYAHFYGGAGTWNDYPNNAGGNIQGYLVEYGGLEPCTPVLTATATVTITVHGLPVVSLSQVPVTCAGGNDGSISVTASNGDTPYQFSIDGGATYQNNNVFAGLTAGNYSIVVKSATGCSSSSNITVTTTPDVTPPVLSAAPLNVTVDCSAVPTAATLTASDNCDGSPVVTFGETSTQDADVNAKGHYNYTITRTWTATDVSGNSTSATQTITVQDITAPSISVPNSVTVNCQDNSSSSSTGVATGSDNCSPVTITQSDVSTQDASLTAKGHYNYTITRTWTATDVSGNSTSATQTITVQDITAPSISVPNSVTVNCQDNSSSLSTGVATGSDNCSPVTITQSDVSTQDASLTAKGHYNYTITRTWTATDVSGNSTSATQTITVQDITAPSISVPNSVTVNCQDNSSSSSTGVATGSDNCSPVTITQSDVSTQDASLTAKGHYNYTITRTWTATDVSGNKTSGTQTIKVQDVTAPTMSTSVVSAACNDLKGNTKTVVLTTSDNCSPVSSTYTLSGATIGSGNGTSVTQSFNIGTTTVTWKSSDVSGNTNSVSTTVVVYPLPVASYTLSNQDNFCNKLYVNGASTLSGPFVYQWYGPASSTTPLATTQVLPLGVASTDGVYNLYTTDGNGCRSEKPATYTYKKDGLISTYTIVGFKEVDLGVNNTVLNGAVGVTALKGEAEMRSGVSIASTGAFLKAPRIDIDGVVNIPTQIKSVAAPVLPTMIYNTTNTRSLPNYQSKTASVGTLSGNYSYVYLRAGSNVTLSGNTFGTIIAEKGATVLFTAPVVNIGNLSVGSTDDDHGDGDDKKTVTTTTTYSNIHFAGNTNVLVSGSVYLGLNTILNAENKKVSFYVGHLRTDGHHENDENGHEGDYNDNDETSFTVVGGDTKVTANVYAPNGEIHVQGSNKGEDSGWKWGGGDNDSKKSPAPTAPTYMTGIFIANQVESDSKGVIWNSFDCGTASAPGFLGAPGNLDNQYVQQAELKGVEVKELTVVASPNPTMNHFRLDITSNDVTTPVTVKVTDAVGRPLELFSKVSVGSSVSFGDRYTAGSYYALVLQGTQYKVVKLVKML